MALSMNLIANSAKSDAENLSRPGRKSAIVFLDEKANMEASSAFK